MFHIQLDTGIYENYSLLSLWYASCFCKTISPWDRNHIRIQPPSFAQPLRGVWGRRGGARPQLSFCHPSTGGLPSLNFSAIEKPDAVFTRRPVVNNQENIRSTNVRNLALYMNPAEYFGCAANASSFAVPAPWAKYQGNLQVSSTTCVTLRTPRRRLLCPRVCEDQRVVPKPRS